MSCHNCERGSYIIPRAAWAPLKELVVAAYNAHRDRLFAQAVALCDEVASLRSAKRGTSVRDALHALRLEQKPYYRTPRPAVAAVHNEELCFILKLWDDKLPRRPKRKLFAHLPARATELTLLDCSLIFKNDSRTVVWSVHESNHAVDFAHEHPVARAFFAALHKIAWTRGSGGFTTYTDEYMRSASDEGRFGDSNSLCYVYGPLGKAEEKARNRAFTAYHGRAPRGRT